MTLQHDSVALAVSRACLEYYRDHDVAGEVDRRGHQLRLIFNEASAAAGLKGCGIGLPARLDLDFIPVGALGCHEQRQIFARALLERGVLPVRVAFACEMMTDADIDKVRDALPTGASRSAIL